MCEDFLEGSHLEIAFVLLTSAKKIDLQLLFFSCYGPEQLFIFIRSAIKYIDPVW